VVGLDGYGVSGMILIIMYGCKGIVNAQLAVEAVKSGCIVHEYWFDVFSRPHRPFSFIFRFKLHDNIISPSRNPWVKDIKQMSFWFNPAWYIWAFHTNRRKWLKWSTAIASIAAIITCVDFGLALAPTSSIITLWLHMTNRDFWIGLLIGALLLIPFSIAWYQNFEGLFTSKPFQSKETPKAFLKQCIKCSKEIPIASEECPYCGAKQKQE